jgi:hypothetical protein
MQIILAGDFTVQFILKRYMSWKTSYIGYTVDDEELNPLHFKLQGVTIGYIILNNALHNASCNTREYIIRAGLSFLCQLF